MIPFIRSLKELELIAKSRAGNSKSTNNKTYQFRYDIRIQEETDKRLRYKRLIDLPNLPNIDRRKWIKSKEFVSRLFDDLDYNNQIQSSYDLTLLARQNKNNNQDAA